jgi:hypothetical protein
LINLDKTQQTLIIGPVFEIPSWLLGRPTENSSASLLNFKLILNCRKKNQPDWITFQASKDFTVIPALRIFGISWLWFFSVKRCSTVIFSNRADSFFYRLVRVWISVIALSPMKIKFDVFGETSYWSPSVKKNLL